MTQGSTGAAVTLSKAKGLFAGTFEMSGLLR